mgnify:CR=1 FL=1
MIKKCAHYMILLFPFLLFISCETTGMGNTYRMDFRSTPLPVMLNANMDADAGRISEYRVFESSSSSTTTYSGYDYTVYETTTSTSTMTAPLWQQVNAGMVTGDTAVLVRDLFFGYHIMMAPYYGENTQMLQIEVSYH